MQERVLLPRRNRVHAVGPAVVAPVIHAAVHCSLQVHHYEKQKQAPQRERSQQEDPTPKDPLQPMLYALYTRLLAAQVRLVDHVSQRMQPQRVRLREHHVIAQRRVLLHVAVEFRRLALLQQPHVVLRMLLPLHERTVEHVRAGGNKSQHTQSERDEQRTEDDIAHERVQTSYPAVVCAQRPHALVRFYVRRRHIAKGTLMQFIQYTLEAAQHVIAKYQLFGFFLQ